MPVVLWSSCVFLVQIFIIKLGICCCFHQYKGRGLCDYFELQILLVSTEFTFRTMYPTNTIVRIFTVALCVIILNAKLLSNVCLTDVWHIPRSELLSGIICFVIMHFIFCFVYRRLECRTPSAGTEKRVYERKGGSRS